MCLRNSELLFQLAMTDLIHSIASQILRTASLVSISFVMIVSGIGTEKKKKQLKRESVKTDKLRR